MQHQLSSRSSPTGIVNVCACYVNVNLALLELLADGREERDDLKGN